MRVIALGFFDGVHLGHGALLRQARRRADELGCSAAAVTFDPHPVERIFGVKQPLINTLADRRRLMTDLYHMDEVLTVDFDQSFMHLPWREFVTDYLVKRLQAVHLVCGHDYAFGYQGLGNARRLKALCDELGVGLDVIERVENGGDVVSSTRIRQLLKEGDLETANQLLGHPHFFCGTVVHGKQLGRRLGFPTANQIMPDGMVEMARGVYATRILLPDGSCHVAVTNVGHRPTVDSDNEVRVESWLLDYTGDLYGQELQVQFCKFLRPEQKFPNIEALTAAIHRDAQSAAAYFSE